MTDNKGRALREISLAGCSCIGKGKNGAVYRLDEETIVKMFDPDSRAVEGCKPDSRRLAEQEQQKAKAAIDLGVPTAIPHGVVRSGESFGLVLEFINARSLRDVIVKEPGRRMTLGADSARLLRKLHGLRVPPGILPRMSDTYRQRAAGLADLLSAEEIMLLNEMIDSIPERPTYVHGDFHRGNLMVRGEELLLIDMADSGMGHPIYDVLGTYMLGMHLVKNFPPEFVRKIVGWDTDTIASVWDVFKRAYFHAEAERELAEIEDMMEAYCPLRWLTFLKLAPAMTDAMRRRDVENARHTFFPMARAHMERFRDRIGAMGRDA